jgi:hypothetical protein
MAVVVIVIRTAFVVLFRLVDERVRSVDRDICPDEPVVGSGTDGFKQATLVRFLARQTITERLIPRSGDGRT